MACRSRTSSAGAWSNIFVVPAKAATHNHRLWWLREVVAPAFVKSIGRGRIGHDVRRDDGERNSFDYNRLPADAPQNQGGGVARSGSSPGFLARRFGYARSAARAPCESHSRRAPRIRQGSLPRRMAGLCRHLRGLALLAADADRFDQREESAHRLALG